MLITFTEEEKAFIFSVRKPQNVFEDTSPIARIQVIRNISRLMTNPAIPADLLQVMSQAQNKLGMMTDQEYREYDFSPAEDEIPAQKKNVFV
ncbi:MAG: hypothetical protein K5897_09305 [Eubacterium sp.]|nr:hypothetical protein [Eubacterium sp.]